MSSRVVLLGPQYQSPNVGAVLAELGVKGPVALVTAGMQEREGDCKDVVKAIGVPVVNLELHKRAEDVFRRDKELDAAYKQRQQRLRLMQDFYRVRLDYADDAAKAISVRHVDPALLAEEARLSVEGLCVLDQDHLERCRYVHAAYEEKMKPTERDAVARHRRELLGLIAPASAVVVAGGHVASLLNRLKLFDIVGLAGDRPWIAWSAGAMVLTDAIVLFHDFPPFGKDIAEVLDAGLGLAPRLVVLPDPKKRLKLDDRAGIARFTRRMSPAGVLAMDHGARVFLDQGRIVKANAYRLGIEGEVETGWTV
jgi:hypothetical protein